MDSQLVKRLKSLAWRAGMVALAAVITFLAQPEIIAELGLPELVTLSLGLVLGEVSKFLNR